MRRTRLFILTLIILSLSAAVAGCGGGMDEGTSEVTIVISDNKTASLNIKKPTIFASLKHRLKKIVEISEASAVPQGVSSISYTVSGSGMSAISGTRPISGSSITIVLYIPNGPDRHFVLDALDASSNVLYRGETYVKLTGAAAKLRIAMEEVVFAKAYVGTGIDIAYSIKQTADGGYIVAGYTMSTTKSNPSAWVLKLNRAGEISWQKSYGGTGTDYAYSIQQTSDGGHIVVGWTNSFGAGGYDMWILKLNSNGAVAWQKAYGGAGSEAGYSIQQTSDGGYIVAGSTSSFGAGGNDIWVLKLNSDGTVAWRRTYGGASDESAYSIQQTTDGGYIVAGRIVISGTTSIDFIWILKLYSDGTIEWQRIYGGAGNENEYAIFIQQTTGGGYIIAGYTNYFGAGGNDMWILKLNSSGSITWHNSYGGTGNDYASSVQQTTDGGYIVAGYTNSFGAGGDDMWILKLNSNGTVAWGKTYGGTSAELAISIHQTSDDGYVIGGAAYSSVSNYDLWIVRPPSDGTMYFNTASGMGSTNALPTVNSATITPVATQITPSSATETVTNTSATVADTNATITQHAP